MLKGALLGFGTEAAEIYAPALLDAGCPLEIQAVAARGPEELQAAIRKFPGARAYRGAEELFAKERGLDFAVVALPQEQRAACALLALENRLHVLCHPPFCSSAAEFDRLNERGGVLGAMETMYQRSKIQDESMYYEMLKHTGKLPIMGVNTFLSSKGSPTTIPGEVIRATETEKKYQIEMLENLHKTNADKAVQLLNDMKLAAIHNKNVFETIMEVSKYCSLGQITSALFEVGGQYRRNM